MNNINTVYYVCIKSLCKKEYCDALMKQYLDGYFKGFNKKRCAF